MNPHRIPSPAPTEAEIQHAAYHLWLQGGCRHGHDLEDWFAARALLQHRHARPAGRIRRASAAAAVARRQPLGAN